MSIWHVNEWDFGQLKTPFIANAIWTRYRGVTVGLPGHLESRNQRRDALNRVLINIRQNHNPRDSRKKVWSE